MTEKIAMPADLWADFNQTLDAGPGPTQMVCSESCGWRSPVRPSLRAASVDLAAHVQIVHGARLKPWWSR